MRTSNFTSTDKPYPLENVYKVLMMAPVKESNMQELYDMGFKQYHDYDPGKRYTITDWYVASQMLVWECQQMMRDKDFVRKANGNRYETGHRTRVYTSKIPADHYLNNLAGTNAKDIYNFMASTIKKRENFDERLREVLQNRPKFRLQRRKARRMSSPRPSPQAPIEANTRWWIARKKNSKELKSPTMRQTKNIPLPSPRNPFWVKN